MGNNDNFSLLISAMVDKAKSMKDMQKDLSSIQKQLQEAYKIKFGVELDDKAAKSITSQQQKLASSIDITRVRADSAQKSLNTYTKSLRSSAVKEYSNRINELSNAFEKAKQSGDRIQYQNAQASLQNFKSQMKSIGAETASFSEQIKDNFSKFSQWFLIGGLTASFARSIKEGISFVADLDDALTNVNYTMNVTSEDLKNIGMSSIDIAKNLNTSAKNVLEAVKLYANANETAETILNKAKPAIMLSNVTGMSGTESAEMLQSIMNQFDLNQNDLMQISDTIQGVSQSMAHDFSDGIKQIANGISTSGSVAHDAGLSLQEYSSILGLIIEQTGEDGGTIGNAMKTILTRITKASSTAGTLTEDISKAEGSLRSVGVEIRSSAGDFRDMTDIMADLGKVWNNLDSVSQSNISYNIAGTRQTNIIKSLLNNWQEYEVLVNKANNSSGVTLENQNKYAESLKGKLSELTSIWQSIWGNTIDSSVLKFVVDLGTGISELIEKTNLLQTALIGLTTFGALKGGVELISWIKNGISSVMAFGNALNTVKTIDSATYYTDLTKTIQGLTLSQATAVLTTQSLKQAEIEATLVNAGFSAEEASTTASTLAMSSAETVATGTTFSLSSAFSALGATIAANPIGAAITAITAIVSVGSLVFNEYKQSQEEVLATSKELTQTYKDQQTSLDEQISSYKTLQSQIDAGNLSTKETASIKSQLLDIQNGLVDTFGNEASGIDLVNGKYKDQLGLLSELTRQKAQDFLAENRSGFETAKKQLNKERTYEIGGIGNNLGDSTLSEYLKKYNNDNVKLAKYSANGVTSYYVAVKGTVEEADKALHTLYTDIEEVGKDTGLDVTNVLTSISDQLNKTWTDDLETYKSTYDEYVKAQVVANDGLRPLYIQSIDAIDAYNKALANGKGIDEAKANLDAIKNSVYKNTDAVEGSKNVFDDLFNKVVSGSNITTQATDQVSTALSSLFTEDQSKAIDTYQTSVKSISDALSNLSSLSTSDIIDLMQQFPDFDWSKYGVNGVKGIGELSEALKALAKQEYDITVATVGENEALKDLYNKSINASSSILSMSDALSEMNATGKSLEDVKSEIKDIGYISSETLTGLVSKYPELESVVAQYNSGLASTEDVLAELTSAYQTDYENYKLSTIAKLEQNESFYSDIVKNLPDWVDNLADSYRIDLSNYRTTQQAKLALDKEMATKQALLLAINENKPTSSWKSFMDDKASKNVEDWLNKGVSDIQSIIDAIDLTGETKLDLKGYTPSAKQVKKERKKDKAELPEAYQKEKAELEHLHSIGKKSDKKYYDELTALKDKYLKDSKKYQSEIYSVEETVINGRKELHRDKAESLIEEQKRLLDTGKIDESTYYKEFKSINDKYFKGKKEYLEDYQKNEDDYNKWSYDQAVKNAKDKIDAYSKSTDEILALYSKQQSRTKDIASTYKDGSDEQVEAYARGLASVNKEISYINKQIKTLKKMKADGSFKGNEEDYTSQLKTLQDALSDTQSSIKDFNDAMADSVKGQQDMVMDIIEKQQDKVIKSIEDEGKAYSDIIEAEKEIIDLKEKQRDYEKDISKKTKEISEIESRMAELKLAASTGDRQAQAELTKLDKERSDKIEDLSEDQHDHEIDLQQSALDKSKSDNEKLYQAKVDAMKSEYDTRVENLNSLYEKEIQLIISAASYTKEEFSKAFNDINAQMTTYGVTQSQSFVDSITKGQAQVTKKSQVLSVLQRSNGNGKGSSDLNDYVKGLGYRQLSYENMAELASILGISGVTASSIKKDTFTKKMIEEELRRVLSGSTYAKGGIGEVVHSLGETGIGLFRNGEALMKQDETKTFKYDFIPTMNKFMDTFKPITPDISKYVTNNTKNSDVTVKFDNMLNIENMSSDFDIVSEVKRNAPKITEIITKTIKDRQ